LTLPSLSEATPASLRSFLAAEASVANPVDMIASATASQYERARAALLDDDAVDSGLVIFIPPLVTKMDDGAAGVRRAAAGRPEKPVIGIFGRRRAAGDCADSPAFQKPRRSPGARGGLRRLARTAAGHSLEDIRDGPARGDRSRSSGVADG
jgi:acyl-CoA synthetase (NDP forming)